MRMRGLSPVIAAFAAAASLAGCGPGGESASAKAAAPVVAQAQTGAEAGAADGAEAFVRGLYAQYDDTPLGTGPEAEPWSARTQALWDENAEAAQGVGYLGFDPVCNCQDWFKLSVSALTVTPAGPDRADAVVTFVNGEPATTVTQTLKLVREGGAWRIDDIVWGPGATMEGEPNMVEGLIASTAEIKAMPQEDQ